MIRLIFKLFPQPIIFTLQQKPLATHIQLGLMLIALLSTFYIETQSFYAANVLQPTNLSKLYLDKRNILNQEQQLKKMASEKRIAIAKQLNNNTSSVEDKFDTVKNYLFAIPQNYDPSGHKERRFSALMLMILLISITAIMLAFYRQHFVIKWAIFMFSFAQAILIPINCGILGTNYEYPVISLAYTEKNDKAQDTILHKDSVFLLAKSQESLIIYDRLNFFQISYIPQSTVQHLEQLFTSSVFSNCSNGGFKPCEIYAQKP